MNENGDVEPDVSILHSLKSTLKSTCAFIFHIYNCSFPHIDTSKGYKLKMSKTSL